MELSLTAKGARNLAKQMRFAASQALNDTAFVARGHLVRDLNKTLTIRRKYTERGFRVRKSNKRDLTAWVGVHESRSYLTDQVTGGIRHDKAIPGPRVRKNPRQVITRKRWPGNILNRYPHQYFVTPTRATAKSKMPRFMRDMANRDRRVVFRRMGGKRRNKLRIMWTLPKTIRIPARFRFQRVVDLAMRYKYPRAFETRLRAAVGTARP